MGLAFLCASSTITWTHDDVVYFNEFLVRANQIMYAICLYLHNNPHRLLNGKIRWNGLINLYFFSVHMCVILGDSYYYYYYKSIIILPDLNLITIVKVD